MVWLCPGGWNFTHPFVLVAGELTGVTIIVWFAILLATPLPFTPLSFLPLLCPLATIFGRLWNPKSLPLLDEQLPFKLRYSWKRSLMIKKCQRSCCYFNKNLKKFFFHFCKFFANNLHICTVWTLTNRLLVFILISLQHLSIYFQAQQTRNIFTNALENDCHKKYKDNGDNALNNSISPSFPPSKVVTTTSIDDRIHGRVYPSKPSEDGKCKFWVRNTVWAYS